VNRKEATNRYIINGDLLFNRIKQEFSSEYDVENILFETMTVEDQIKTMIDCKIMIGCHGAGLTNCMFMSKDSLLIELFPECFYTDCFKNLSKKLNINHLLLHGTNKEKSKISLEIYIKEGCKDQRTRFMERDKSFDIDIDTIIKLMKSYINSTNFINSNIYESVF
jgi:capsular polysaccharide biosynthesis protein